MTRRIAILTAFCMFLFPVFARAQANDGHGKEWRQLVETTNLSWEQVSQVCPTDGVSSCTGVVGDRDLTGWVWATQGQVTELFSYYAPEILESSSVFDTPNFFTAAGFLDFLAPTFGFALDFQFSYWGGGWTSSI